MKNELSISFLFNSPIIENFFQTASFFINISFMQFIIFIMRHKQSYYCPDSAACKPQHQSKTHPSSKAAIYCKTGMVFDFCVLRHSNPGNKSKQKSSRSGIKKSRDYIGAIP